MIDPIEDDKSLLILSNSESDNSLDEIKDALRVMAGPPGTGKSFTIFAIVKILALRLAKDSLTSEELGFEDECFAIVDGKLDLIDFLEREISRLLATLDGQQNVVDDLTELLKREGPPIIGIVTPSNDLRKTYCQAVAAWLEELQVNDCEVPCKIIYIGPDENNLLPINDFVKCVPFPNSDMGTDPRSSKKPLLIIGCLSRFCAYVKLK